jgi:membrane-associated phospholipid phosphatase
MKEKLSSIQLKELFWIAFYFLFTNVGYFYFSKVPTSNQMKTSWDKYVPVVPIFVIPYLINIVLYAALPFIFFLWSDFKKTKEYMIALLSGFAVLFSIYAIYPTAVSRGYDAGNGVFADMLRDLWERDGASAAFPSGHVLEVVIFSYFLWKYFPKTKPFIIILAPIITLSVVFTKQHYLLDIPAGIFVGIIAIYISKKLTPILP